jgi:hypothetical protein
MTLRYFCRFALAVLAALSLPPALGGQPAPAPLSTAASLVGGQKAHLFGGQFDPNNATTVPAEIKPEWAALIGEYGPELGRFYVLEDGGELQILAGWFDLETLHPVSEDVFELPANGPQGAQRVTFSRDAAHAVKGVRVGSVNTSGGLSMGPDRSSKLHR